MRTQQKLSYLLQRQLAGKGHHAAYTYKIAGPDGGLEFLGILGHPKGCVPIHDPRGALI